VRFITTIFLLGAFYASALEANTLQIPVGIEKWGCERHLEYYAQTQTVLLFEDAKAYQADLNFRVKAAVKLLRKQDPNNKLSLEELLFAVLKGKRFKNIKEADVAIYRGEGLARFFDIATISGIPAYIVTMLIGNLPGANSQFWLLASALSMGGSFASLAVSNLIGMRIANYKNQGSKHVLGYRKMYHVGADRFVGDFIDALQLKDMDVSAYRRNWQSILYSSGVVNPANIDAERFDLLSNGMLAAYAEVILQLEGRQDSWFLDEEKTTALKNRALGLRQDWLEDPILQKFKNPEAGMDVGEKIELLEKIAKHRGLLQELISECDFFKLMKPEISQRVSVAAPSAEISKSLFAQALLLLSKQRNGADHIKYFFDQANDNRHTINLSVTNVNNKLVFRIELLFENGTVAYAQNISSDFDLDLSELEASSKLKEFLALESSQGEGLLSSIAYAILSLTYGPNLDETTTTIPTTDPAIPSDPEELIYLPEELSTEDDESTGITELE